MTTPAPGAFPCPHCHQPSQWTDNPFRPFCSERCRLMDLGAWASESYRIAEQQPAPWELTHDRDPEA